MKPISKKIFEVSNENGGTRSKICPKGLFI